MGWGLQGRGVDPCLIHYRVYFCIRVGCTYTMMEALLQSGFAARALLQGGALAQVQVRSNWLLT